MDFKKKIMTDLNLTNPMAIPRVVKIVVNVGAGEAVSNKKVLEKITDQLSVITGQRPVITLARKSISAFKVRRGIPIGVKVTLRGKRMNYFLEKLVKIIIPRMKDFRGLSEKSIDQGGNLNLGLPEQTIFPEIDYDKIDKIRGLEVTLVTNASNHHTGLLLFKALGIPFKTEENKN